MALHGKATLSKIQDGIDNGTPFHAGNVRGLVGAADGFWLTGRMSEASVRKPSVKAGEEWASEYRSAARDNAIAYTILSYATPIAWKTIDGGWHIPDLQYSITTSAHQGVVRVATKNPGFYPVGR